MPFHGAAPVQPSLKDRVPAADAGLDGPSEGSRAPRRSVPRAWQRAAGRAESACSRRRSETGGERAIEELAVDLGALDVDAALGAGLPVAATIVPTRSARGSASSRGIGSARARS